MITAQRIEIIRTRGAPRRIPPARRIRRHVDADRLKVIWQSEIYGALLRLEERCEQSRDALRSNDFNEAAGIGRDLALRAMTIARGLDRLRSLP
jgi:hypothetical protein